MDANSKLQTKNIASDPRKISANGQILIEIVQINGPIIVNSTSKCFGAIARVRKTNIYHEKSIIDFLFFEMISSMDIDEACK